jgi:ubiquinone/menaquinone biosynthesis C-methylase UbiE
VKILSSLKYNIEVVQQIAARNKITANGNIGVYESEDVVEDYITKDDLQKPEATILNELKNKLPNMRMLDIGVGAGRTTTHFSCLVKEYVGIDYSNKMINACIKKFENCPNKISFLTADARSMNFFKNSSFDFVLFSFNGIDYADHEERMVIMSEIRRLIKPRGYFCFSTHNLNVVLKDFFSIQLSKNPKLLAIRARELLQMRLLNKGELWKAIRNPSGNQRHLMVNDGAHNFRLKTYFITPVEQLNQLHELGYSDIKMYSLRDGREIKNPNNAIDRYIYYLSRAP